MADDSATELKRLAPVAAGATAAASRAGELYVRAKTFVPDRFKSSVEAAESQVVGLASPYVPALLDKSTAALKAVDSKVDATILSAWQAYLAHSESLGAAVAQQRAARAADLEQLNAARLAYLKRVEEAVAGLKETGLQGTAKAAADALQAKVEEARALPHAVLTEVAEAWARFVRLPAVERLLAASRGSVEAAYTQYMGAHDALVADPRYARAVAKGSQALASLQASAAYRSLSGRLGPLLAPYADTELAKRAAPYVQAVATHLAPVAAA